MQSKSIVRGWTRQKKCKSNIDTTQVMIGSQYFYKEQVCKDIRFFKGRITKNTKVKTFT